jgi:N6-L-threonylcarbamoyladenine synthase
MTIQDFCGISKGMKQARNTTTLAIETSCDETAVAVLRKEGNTIHVLASAVASQVDIHKQTGGVIPEAAAREHVTVITPLLKHVLEDAEQTEETIDTISVTVGPGLQPALSVGVTAARSLSFVWGRPRVPVHHIEGHVYSALLQLTDQQLTTFEMPLESFPALALIVSGGHTMLIEVEDHLRYRVIGTTRDDAVGEVFDKVARMIGLPYPGGPQVSKLAEQGNPAAFSFPRPMLDSGDLDFSYSGLKTAVLYTIRDITKANPEGLEAAKPDIAASFQQAVIDSVVKKVEMAVEKKRYQTVLLAGGVAANAALRKQLADALTEKHVQLRIAPLPLCGDNAVMIGQVGLYAHDAGRTAQWRDIDALARIPIETFSQQK